MLLISGPFVEKRVGKKQKDRFPGLNRIQAALLILHPPYRKHLELRCITKPNEGTHTTGKGRRSQGQRPAASITLTAALKSTSSEDTVHPWGIGG